jgi:acyl-CoA reductase-like NAD-dependent aldehyde dehydrogenase
VTSIERPHDLGQVNMLIGGRFCASSSGQWFDVLDPSTQVALAEVPRGRAEDVAVAVRAAAAAFETWRHTPPEQRGEALLRVADDLRSEGESLARLLAAETGNALRTQARPEIATVWDTFRYFGGVARELKGETVPLGSGLLSYSVREPYGVVGAIVPWNSPALLAAMKIAMAVVTGNTIVLKAAEDAPLTVLAIGAILNRHLPPGVVNILTGYGPECGQPLLESPHVAKLSFTGSTAVGKLAMRIAAERVPPPTLELGGKSPAIVFPDRDDDETAAGVIAGMRFTRQSQSCTAGSRLLLHESIFDSFLDRLVKQVDSLSMGDPLAEETDIGTIINERQYRRVCSFLTDGEIRSASVLTGGAPSDREMQKPGYFIRPTILTGIDPAWRVAREEVFGPVLVALPWREQSEAVAMANDTHYGLAAFIWSRDISAALRVAHAVDAGWVQVNRGGGQLLGMSYGGRKESGLGHEFSLEGALEGFTHRKSITVDIGSAAR